MAVHDPRSISECHNGEVVQRASRRGPLALITVVAVLAISLLSLRPLGAGPGWEVVLDRAAPLALLLAGIVGWIAGRTSASVWATLSAVGWVGLSWTSVSVQSFGLVPGVGLLLAPLLVPSLALLAIEIPVPVQSGGWNRRLPVLAIVSIALLGMVRAIIYDPFLDPDCQTFCGHNAMALIPSIPLAAMLGAMTFWTTALACGSIVLVLLVRLIRLPPAGVGSRVATAMAVVAMAGFVGAALSTVIGEAMTPTAPDPVAGFLIWTTASILLALALILVAAERLAVRRNLAQVARLLGSYGDPLPLQAMLRRAVDDPTLRVGYWLDETGYVDFDGMPLDAAQGKQRTELSSRGRPVAIVIHDERASASELLQEQLGPQARLAVQNESLQLELRRRVDELQASRWRIVEVGEGARRRLERDLHDGAQQQLLALSFELRRGERAAAGAGDVRSTALFADARAAASRALEQLRLLAHGIHPGILTGAGLEEALISYAATATPSPRLVFDLGGHLPEAIESALYAIVTALVDTTGTASASVSIRRDGDSVRVIVENRDHAPEYVLDRVGAAGGSSVTTEHRLEFVLPCV